MRDICLAQEAGESADLELGVHGDDAPLRAATGYNVTPCLANLLEPQPLQCLQRLGAGDSRELRHGLEQRRS